MTNTKTNYRKLVALDFDGVLHSYTSPWTDAATISDPPTPGAMAFLRSLVDDGRFDVVIVSSRLSFNDGEQAILVWLEAHVAALTDDETAEVVYTDGTPPGSVVIDRTPIDRRTVDRIMRGIRFSSTRPPAFLTIDDRAVTFDGTWLDLDTIAAFKPWNKRMPVPERLITFAEAVDAERLDEIENDRLEGDIRDLLGSLGCVTPLRSLETDEIVGWSVFDGAVTIERDDLPVCAGDVEGVMTREHRLSILRTIKTAFLAGRGAAQRSGRAA